MWNWIENSPNYIKSAPWHCHRNNLFHLEGAFGFQISGAKQEECASHWGKQGCELVKNRKGNAAESCAPDICQPLPKCECIPIKLWGRYYLCTFCCADELEEEGKFIWFSWFFKRNISVALFTRMFAVLSCRGGHVMQEGCEGWMPPPALVPAWGGTSKLLPAPDLLLPSGLFERWWVTNVSTTLCNVC